MLRQLTRLLTTRAEFYGRPNDEPEKVSIKKPLVGEASTVERRLLGKVEDFDGIGVKRHLALDARMKKIALRKGYDSIIVLAETGLKHFRVGSEKSGIPHSGNSGTPSDSRKS